MNDTTFNKLAELLQQVKWSFINFLDIDEAFSKFHETFMPCVDVVAPGVNVIIPAYKAKV